MGDISFRYKEEDNVSNEQPGGDENKGSSADGSLTKTTEQFIGNVDSNVQEMKVAVKPVEKYNIQSGEVLQTFESSSEASKNTPWSRIEISLCCIGMVTKIMFVSSPDLVVVNRLSCC